MKNKLLLGFVLLFPLLSFSQNNNDTITNSGYRVGINSELVLLGEYGFFGEYYFNKNSIYIQLNYNRPIISNMYDRPNVDLANNTNSYYCASGPLLKIGYQKIMHYYKKNNISFFYSTEFIYKNLSYNHLTLERPSDDRYVEIEKSLNSSRFGAAVRFGLRKNFLKNSKAFWALSIGSGGLFRYETTIYYKSNLGDVLNTPIITKGFISTVSFNLVLGFDIKRNR